MEKEVIGKSGLRKEMKIPDFFIGWPMPAGGESIC